MLEDPILSIVTKLSSTFSILGSLYLIFKFYNANTTYRTNLSNRVILYMSLLDVVGSINFFIGSFVFNSTIGCSIQGIIVEMMVAGPLWNSVFVLNVLLRVVFNVHKEKANSLEFIYHLVVWGIPIAGNIAALSENAYSIVGAWCWYKPEYVLLRFGTFYGWVFASVLFNIIVSICVIWYIKITIGKYNNNKNLLRSGQRQLLYVVAFIISFGPSSLLRLMQLATGKQNYTLTVIQATTLPLQGFLNCIVYLILQKRRKTQTFTSIQGLGSSGSWHSQAEDSVQSRRQSALLELTEEL